MKKLYMKPETIQVKCFTENVVLAGSFNLDENGGTGNPSEHDAEDDGLGNSAGSSWDDED